jgi:hypothetical protein
MRRIVRALRDRYFHPDFELGRRELRWVGRWLTRGAGGYWLATFAALEVAETLVQRRLAFGLSERLIERMSVVGTVLHSAVFLVSPSAIVLCFLWTSLALRRTLAPLRGERGAELLLADPPAKSLWPALLFAPILGVIALQTAAMAARIVYFSIAAKPWLLLSEIEIDRPSDVVLAVARWIGPRIIGWAGSAAIAMWLTAFAVQLCLFRGGAIRFIILLIAARIGFEPLVTVSTFLAPHIIPKLVEAQYGSLGNLYNLLSLLFGLALFLAAILRLRHPRTQARIRAALEAGR